jgi:hypothetical protein
MVAPVLGLHAQAGGIDRDFVDEFLIADKQHHRKELRAARASGDFIKASSGAGFATMSLTGILENILNKSMLEQYGLQLSVVSDIAFERDTTDFKPYKVYRLTASGDLEPVGPGGEIKTMSLQDESYSNQVSTKAALIPVKREDIQNDDMGALTQTSQIAGRKGALNREKAVFSTFLSGLTTVAPGASVGKAANGFNFFSAGAKNLLSGAGSALSIASLTTAAKTFVQQTDANGDPIMIAPDRLLCCPEVFDTAKALYGGASVVVGALGSTTSKSLDPNLNVHAGSYRPIRSPFLGGASPLTGASATQWALLCNPAGGTATTQVGYLRGQRTPIIRQVDVDATMLGLAYQIIFDFGVSLLDYRCGVYSAGA